MSTVTIRATAILFGLALCFLTASRAAAEEPIDGFRSAKFGMTKAQVLAAIATDFRIDRKKIGEARNLVEKTELLAIRVDDMIPDSGGASVVYTLGYETKKLIQTTIQFGRPADKDIKPAALWATARLLQQALLAKEIDKSRVLLNKTTNDQNAVVLYRGVDKAGRMAMLTAFFEPQKQKGREKAAIDVSRLRTVRLQYVANPKKPDIYKPKKGDF